MATSKTTTKKLRRKQLDAFFAKIDPFVKLATPNAGGWVKDLREALGISPTQLASLLSISRPTLLKLEAGEEKQTITLQSLNRIAAAMNCRVVYTLVPERENGSLDAILKNRAIGVATKIIGKVSKTMALEDQAVEKSETDRQIQELADELVRNLDKRLWEKA